MEQEVNKVIRKTTTAIRTLAQLKSSLPITYKITLLKSLVLCHLNYSLPLLVGVREKAQSI